MRPGNVTRRPSPSRSPAVPVLTAGLLVLLAGWPAGATAADEVVTPIALTGENVEVLVGPGISLVEGTYDYIYVRRWDNATTSAPILIDVPVFAAADTDFAGLLAATDIQLKLGGEVYLPFAGDFVDHTSWTTIPFVPEGSRIFEFHFKLPRTAVKRRFTATVNYAQAHLGPDGQQVFALIPYLPKSERLEEDLHLDPADYTLKFSPMSGYRLQLVSANPERVSVAGDKIVLHARDRESIAIRVEKAEGGTPQSP